MVFLQEGVEQLWQKDISNYSLAAVSDIVVNCFPGLIYHQRNQTKTNNYFNSGVCLFNLKKIRETKKCDQLAKWVKDWDEKILAPKTQDQTLLNYLFRDDDVLYLDYKFNDFSLVITSIVYKHVKQFMKQHLGYQFPVNSVKDAVILHFLGDLKPWRKEFDKLQKIAPYYYAIKEIWKKIEEELGKKEQK